MELFLQFGHGMKSMCLELLRKWNGGTVILSPVNIKENKLTDYSEEFREQNGRVLFDPQIFFKKDVHLKLRSYSYWPNDNVSTIDSNTELIRINNVISSDAIILPSLQLNEINHKEILEQLNSTIDFFRRSSSKNLYATITLYPEAIRNHDFIEYICNFFVKLDVDGYYVVPHPPNGEYIVSDGSWTIGMLKLLTCLKFTKRKVIVGYSNHQGLIFSLANVDAIASGSFMNTRSFSPLKFKNSTEGKKQKSVWFYVPSAMCEYKAIQLDIAKQRGFLHFFEPQGLFANDYSEKLFSGATPSSTNFNESDSFKHYLHCLKIQCDYLSNASYSQTYSKYEFLLNSAEFNIQEIKKYGISGQNRDFSNAIESNRVAMIACNHDYGFKLKMEWEK